MGQPDDALQANTIRADAHACLQRGPEAGALVRAILGIAASAMTAAALAKDVPAQGTQWVEDKDVGVRFAIPKDWEWRSRDRDVFVDCAPKAESRPGMPVCYFMLARRKLAQGQGGITDADRAKWKSWTMADDMRPLVSARDLKVAGNAAYEVVVKEGTERDAATSVRVFIPIPGTGLIDAWLYMHPKIADQSARVRQSFYGALESLKPTK